MIHSHAVVKVLNHGFYQVFSVTQLCQMIKRGEELKLFQKPVPST